MNQNNKECLLAKGTAQNTKITKQGIVNSVEMLYKMLSCTHIDNLHIHIGEINQLGLGDVNIDTVNDLQ